ncbi:hypothetical protein [Candidatus Roseilinea sp. NK_OTU-006]|jgi:hypothetical protein|uniref:hypothetical protein n=1 Tax=Candidatus Roseilinea sp. NK_OTU-006 TaxID=2704250 RepID=UPI00145E12EE|nr:hypothetical protein [Candidatus Roseilinea sp. NK_OTU-006]
MTPSQNRGASLDRANSRQADCRLPPRPSALSWRGWASPLVWTPLVLPSACALFAPTDVLHRWPLARALTTSIAEVFPRVVSTAKATQFPEVALLTYCLVILLWLPISLLYALQSHANYDYALPKARSMHFWTVKRHLGLLLGALLAPLLIFALTMMPGDPALYTGVTTKSRVGLAFMAFCCLWGASLLLGFQYGNVRLFIDLQLRRNDHE